MITNCAKTCYEYSYAKTEQAPKTPAAPSPSSSPAVAAPSPSSSPASLDCFATCPRKPPSCDDAKVFVDDCASTCAEATKTIFTKLACEKEAIDKKLERLIGLAG